MKVAVLGTGTVGNTLASKLVQLGHDVKMGSRTATNEKAAAWVKLAGGKASQGTFADAAAFGEVLFLCTAGMGALEALKQAGAPNLKGKLLLDITNPLDFSNGMPPSIFTARNDSLGEQIQKAFPDAKVVKTLNTVNALLMVDPLKLSDGGHTMFVSGNDAEAKGRTTEILKGWFHWKHVLDLGDITGARAMESYLPLWLRLWGALHTPDFSIQVVRN